MDDLWVQLNLFLYALIAGVTYAFDAQASLRANQLRRSQLEAQLNDARLQALKAQLQPHFLFNTLGAIQTLVLRHGANDAAQMISRLSEYLRTTLDDDVRQEVPLAVEIEGTNQYLSIETCRFGDRLVVEQSIDPDARAILVPHLVLQPIVENAIRHGFAAVRGPFTSGSMRRYTRESFSSPWRMTAPARMLPLQLIMQPLQWMVSILIHLQVPTTLNREAGGFPPRVPDSTNSTEVGPA